MYAKTSKFFVCLTLVDLARILKDKELGMLAAWIAAEM
jgi:hypothetical protein